ncbi:kinase-like domain-containing protein [Rhizophagus diaphanus]|nr:kinase-like domain-containing protein [Rhizophagus diaphanus] [Rhizophagus sp. MUCL 43196]
MSFVSIALTLNSKTKIEWIPFPQIINLEEIAEGGFGIVYQAIWRNKKVAVKKFARSENSKAYFLNELRTHCKCCDCGCINKCYGITKDPITEEYMLVLQYADGGNLHEYLKNNFSNITWKEKLNILHQISMGLRNIHKIDFTHRDLHSGNILHFESNLYKSFQIADLGLAQPENISNDEINGVIPYMAPEIFIGSKFSKASDVYSMGMIMWEITTGCKPFANVEHDYKLIYDIIDGKRPNITEDTPECIADLMIRCWNSDPGKRPSMDEIHQLLSDMKNEEFNGADQKRLELIELKKLGPEYNEKPHLKAIYTSRSLSSYSDKFISLTKQDRQGYITREYEFDI